MFVCVLTPPPFMDLRAPNSSAIYGRTLDQTVSSFCMHESQEGNPIGKALV